MQIAKVFFSTFPNVVLKESAVAKTLDDYLTTRKPKEKRTPKPSKAKNSTKNPGESEIMVIDSPGVLSKTPKQEQVTSVLAGQIEAIQINQLNYQTQLQEIGSQLSSVIGFLQQLSKPADPRLIPPVVQQAVPLAIPVEIRMPAPQQGPPPPQQLAQAPQQGPPPPQLQAQPPQQAPPQQQLAQVPLQAPPPQQQALNQPADPVAIPIPLVQVPAMQPLIPIEAQDLGQGQELQPAGQEGKKRPGTRLSAGQAKAKKQKRSDEEQRRRDEE